jgi:hypothetical protein
MLAFVLALFSAFLVGLAVASGVRFRVRLKRRLRRSSPVVDDDALRRILEEGRLSTDEDAPLDYDEIDEEERRFWSSDSWDEPDEW